MNNALLPGDSVFIDANIFLYRIFDHWKYGRTCTKFLKDINYGKYSGVTSVFVCNEVFHRVMIAELFEKYNINSSNARKYLKENPDIVMKLMAPKYALENIDQIANLKILGVEKVAIKLAASLSLEYGLLATDAIHLATMKLEGLKVLATNDRDFNRVDWLELWKP